MTQVCFDNKCPHYYQYDFSNIILKHGLTRFQGRKNTGYMGTYNYPRSPDARVKPRELLPQRRMTNEGIAGGADAKPLPSFSTSTTISTQVARLLMTDE